MSSAFNLTKTDIQKLVCGAFSELASEVDDGFAPTSSQPDLEILEQRCAAQERVAQLTGTIASHGTDEQAVAISNSKLRQLGLAPADLAHPRRLDMYHGVMRALVQQQHLFLLRLEDRLAPFVPRDPLFCDAIDCNPIAPHATQAATPRADLGPSLGSAVADYLTYGGRRWTVKTLKSRKRMLGLLVEHAGAGVPLASIAARDIREFRDGVCRLRATHHRGADRSFVGRQTDNEAARISDKTAALIFEPTKAFFRWAATIEGLIDVDPTASVRLQPPSKAKQKNRRPFVAHELQALFTSPVFIGCKSARRRLEPGASSIQDAYYWIPLLAYFSGARLGELVQLHLSDVVIDRPIPYMAITEANAGEVGSDTAKHVKSAAGVRRVPLHPTLINLGFADFVEKRRDQRRGFKRLFSEIPFGADGQASTTFSKWFGRLMHRIGLKDPALVFHSFRHTAKDAFSNALQPQYVIDRIIGHSDGKVSSQYGDGVSLETAYNAICAMKLPFDVQQVLRPPST